MSTAVRAGNQAVDPTRTKTLRTEYAQRFRGWLGKLNAVIRDSVQSRNVFGINQQDPVPPPIFAFPRDDRKIEAFMRWLRQQERRGILSIISADDNTWIRAAYQRGVEHADDALQAEGVTVPPSVAAQIFNLPVHREALQFLYTRNFEELQGITEAMNQQISRELADGLTAGEQPYKIAGRLTDRVDKIGKTRATVLARTEIIRAHTEATLNRFERFDVGEVRIKAEWSTAGDNRVCPLCRGLEGRTWTLDEIRSETFTFKSSEFPVRPPSHPQCRCALLPVV